ncbi:MAG: TauD/TfdA family dioxygenase [Actinomycetota bacterium]|jgi:taurine dioxygenase|nr:TauD/TfdA family dioxygenase [Actinomycetota bacterium]
MQIFPMTGSFGAEIRGTDLGAGLSPEQVAAVQAAFAEHAVLCFRDQDLDIERFEGLALQLGEFGETPFVSPIEGHPNVLRLVREADEAGPLFGSGWHSDWSFQSAPPSATMLYGLEVPPSGGDTAFINQYLAYESLSSGMRRMIDGLNAVHSARRSYGPQGTFGRNDPASSMDINGGESALATQLHPLVRTHPVTGRKALFVNDVYTIGIEDMHAVESKPLLDFLFAHSRRIDHTCRVRWEPGTLTMWDNRVTQHYAIDDYAGHRREMYRITLAGEVPV